METRVVNSPQDNGVVALFHKQSAAVMEFTAVQTDTLAMFLREAAVKEA